MKPTKIRYQVLFLIFVNVVINYMDRSNLAVAASEIDKEFKFTPVQLGLIFSAFSWTYLAFPGICQRLCFSFWSSYGDRCV